MRSFLRLPFALLVGGILPVGAARAQVQLAPPSLSPGCEAPAADISSTAPLPHLAGLLQGGGRIRVLALGTSMIAASALSPAKGYPAQLESILEGAFKGVDVVIVNRGMSGEVAATTAERMKAQVALEKPNLVLWQVGTNDALARVPVESFTATLRDALGWLREHDIDTVLVGLQYSPNVVRDDHYNAIRAALREVASAENVLLVRRYDAMQFIEAAQDMAALGDLRAVDPGYRCTAEHIARAVVVSAFLARRRGGVGTPK